MKTLFRLVIMIILGILAFIVDYNDFHPLIIILVFGLYMFFVGYNVYEFLDKK